MRASLALDAEGMADALEALVKQSVRERKRGTPPLSKTRTRYQREERGHEDWQSAAETTLRGVGDCEDLAIHLCGDMRFAGLEAFVKIVRMGPTTLHALVKWRRPGEKQWHWADPSRARGMKGRA